MDIILRVIGFIPNLQKSCFQMKEETSSADKDVLSYLPQNQKGYKVESFPARGG